MSSEQNYLQMRVLIQKHKDNERIYKEKISEVNLTRAKITDQLQVLKQSYDKKIKTLEQRLENMKLQNEALIRQNVLFKTQIDTFQNRLLQKEKIIAVLLNQKRETLVIGNSQRSKSDKTDSNHANEQQGKYFKKQTPVYRDLKEEIQTGYPIKPKYDQVLKGITEVKQNPLQSQLGKEKNNEDVIHQGKKTVQPQYLIESEQPVNQSFHPPPPPKKSRVQPSKNLEVSKVQSSATQLFSDLTLNNQERQQEQRTFQIAKKPPPVAHKRPNAKKAPKIPQKIVLKQPQVYQTVELNQDESQSHQIAHQQVENIAFNPNYQLSNQNQEIYQQIPHYPKQENNIAQQVYHEEQVQQNQQVAEPYYAQHFQQTDTVAAEERHIEAYQQQYQTHQTFQKVQPPKEEGESYNNFLSHFTSQPQANEQMANASMSPKPVSRKKKAGKKVGAFAQDQHLEQDQSINSADFFSQLNKHDHEVPHQLDIEQSSIDHNDRDSSLISNQQHYFAEQQTAQKAKPVKMTKKKGKRDQIKVADPSLFE